MVGTLVQVQNQAGPHKDKWDLSGTVVEVLTHDAYHVKMDGSGRVTKRNRRFLPPNSPYTSLLKGPAGVKDIEIISNHDDEESNDLTSVCPGPGDDSTSVPGAGVPGGSGMGGPVLGTRAR